MMSEDLVKKFVEYFEFPDNDVEFNGFQFIVKCRELVDVIQIGLDRFSIPYSYLLKLVQVDYPTGSEFKVIYTFSCHALGEDEAKE